MKKVFAILMVALFSLCTLSYAAETKLGYGVSVSSERWAHKVPTAQSEGHYALSLADTAYANKIGAYLEVVSLKYADGATSPHEWADKFQIPPFLKGYAENYKPEIVSKTPSTFVFDGGVPATVTVLELLINGNKRYVAFVSWEAKYKGEVIFGYMRVSNLGSTTPLTLEGGPLKELLSGIKLSNDGTVATQ